VCVTDEALQPSGFTTNDYFYFGFTYITTVSGVKLVGFTVKQRDKPWTYTALLTSDPEGQFNPSASQRVGFNYTNLHSNTGRSVHHE
jgi:hypothetical protein